MHGVIWKEALVGLWTSHPEERNVRIWEYNSGVEVSSCTYNARRRRLITLLGTKTLINYLQNISLTWKSEDCQKAFYEAIQHPRHTEFRKLYELKKEWQPDLGKAIQHCLDALLVTGLNESGFELLWAPGREPAREVNIKSRHHTWTGLLKDTEDICTMAVFENQCLVIQDVSRARKCQHPPLQTRDSVVSASHSAQCPMDMSILTTSVVLNMKAIPEELEQVEFQKKKDAERRYRYRWKTSLLKECENFRFGPNGQLKIITTLDEGRMLAKWRSSWEIVNKLSKLKMQVQTQDFGTVVNIHEETMGDDKVTHRPLDVIIMSSTPERPAAFPLSLATAAAPVVEQTPLLHRQAQFWTRESNVPRASERASDQDLLERFRGSIERGRRGASILIEVGEDDSLMQLVQSLVAQITVPYLIETESLGEIGICKERCGTEWRKIYAG
jgi:hypothetical protein